jgi:uncharacterized protein (TIGR02996 family)
MEEEAFLRAIAAAPADDAPRLVYADWLDEHGDPRAEFLRAEVAFAATRGAADSPVRLLEQRTKFDPSWWPRVARAAAGPRMVLRCAVCRLPLTVPLNPLGGVVWLSQADATPLVPAGFLWKSDGTVWNGTADHYCVNLADLRNSRPHPDPHRRVGCCGPSGHDGVNTICRNGHEVGTECSDCWMPHFLHWDPKATEGIDADSPTYS